MALLADFKARFPAFDTTVADTWVPILENVYTDYYNREYVPVYQEPILNLIAHLITMETTGGAAGVQQVASKSVGSVSVSYQAGAQSQSANDVFFNATKYGQRFLQLIRHDRGGVAV